jgi:hypothetical protein
VLDRRRLVQSVTDTAGDTEVVSMLDLLSVHVELTTQATKVDVYQTFLIVELDNTGMDTHVDLIQDSVDKDLTTIQVLDRVEQDQLTQLVVVVIDTITDRFVVLEEVFTQIEHVEVVDTLKVLVDVYLTDQLTQDQIDHTQDLDQTDQ